MPDSSHPPASEPLIRAIAMPADSNPSGDIFGGWLMSQMDLAAANAQLAQAATAAHPKTPAAAKARTPGLPAAVHRCRRP